jgi:hypothetical protein
VKEASMNLSLRLSVGLAVGLVLWTATALAQGKPACDQQGKVKTAEKVQGEVTKVDVARGSVTVREADGKLHEFQASPETLQDLKVGGHIEARLREAPKC